MTPDKKVCCGSERVKSHNLKKNFSFLSVLAKWHGPRYLQGLCNQHIGALAGRDSRDGLWLGERRDGQDRDEAPLQDEAELLRGREGLGPDTPGPPQEEHGHVWPVVADPLCKALSEPPGAVLREQGEGPRGVHDGAHRGHRVQGGQGPKDHLDPFEKWKWAAAHSYSTSKYKYVLSCQLCVVIVLKFSC